MGQVSDLFDSAYFSYSQSNPKFILSVTLTPKHAISYDVNCEREFHHNLTEIDLIKEKLEIVDEGSVAPGDRYCCTKFTLDDDAAFSSSGSLSYRFYQFGSITIQKRDGSHYSFISRDLKGVYARVFVLYDTVTFIDMGGKMDMRPKRCLESRELKLVHAAERYVQGSIHYPEPSIDNIF